MAHLPFSFCIAPKLPMASLLLSSLLPHYCKNVYEPVLILSNPHGSPALLLQFQKVCYHVHLLLVGSLSLYSTLTLNNNCLFPSPTVCPLGCEPHGSKDSIIIYGSLSFFSRVPSGWYCLKPQPSEKGAVSSWAVTEHTLKPSSRHQCFQVTGAIIAHRKPGHWHL